jgi:hypothetical protein
MDPNNKNSNQENTENKLTQSPEANAEAARTAEEDIANDPEFSASSPNDDLDEGETARLGEDETPLV